MAKKKVAEQENGQNGTENKPVRQKPKLWKRDWFQRLMMLVLILVLGVVAATVAVVERQVSPTVVFETCIDCFGTGNISDLWEMSGHEQNGMVTLPYFEEWCMEGRSSYLLEYHYEKEKKDGNLYYHVTYREEDTPDARTFDIVLKPTGKRKYLIFPLYQYSIDEQIAKNLTISVLAGCRVTLEDRPLEEYYTGTEDGYDTYLIPEIFKGAYELVIESNIVTSVSTELAVEQDGVTYTMENNTELSEAAKERLLVDVQELTLSMYQELMEQDPAFDEFMEQSAYSFTEDGTKALKKVYGQVRGQLYLGEDNYNIEISSIHDMVEKKLEVSSYTYPESAGVTYQFQYDYEGSGDYDIILGDRYTAKGRRSIAIAVSFTNVDNDWSVNGFTMKVKEVELPEEEEED